MTPPHVDYLELPVDVDIQGVTDDERVHLLVELARIRGSAEMRRSAFVESHVGRVLGAQWPEHANAPADLYLDDIAIQVRAPSAGGRVDLAKSMNNADVLVVAEKPATGTNMTGTNYWVASTKSVKALEDEAGQKTMSLARFVSHFKKVAVTELEEKIRSAALSNTTSPRENIES